MYATRSADVAPASLDAERGEIDVIFGAGADAPRRTTFGEPFIERLLMGPENVDLSRLQRGGAVLDSHRRESSLDVMGKVLPGTARVEGGRAVARLRYDLKDPKGAVIFRKIQDGILTGVSYGYRIDDFRVVEPDDEDGVPVVEVTRHTPFEISSLPIGEDANAGFRAFGADGETEITLKGFRDMSKTTTTNQEVRDLAPAPAPVAAPDLAAERAAGVTAERERQNEIRLVARKLGLGEDAEVVRGLLNGDVPIEGARAVLIDARAAADAAEGGSAAHAGIDVGPTHDEKRAQAMTRALLCRAAPGVHKPDEGAREFRGMRMIDFARAALEDAGVKVRGLGPEAVARRALRLRTEHGRDLFERGLGMHSTSDFPLILADVMRSEMLRGYNGAPRTFEPLSRRKDLPDLRAANLLRMGENPGLVEVLEGAEYTYGTISEGREQWHLHKYGRKFAITLEALINDQMDAFSAIPGRWGAAASRLESQVFWNLVKSNPNLSDGVAVFAAGHANIIAGGAGGAPSVDELRDTQLLLDKMTDADGNLLDISARYIVVPPELEVVTSQLLSDSYLPTSSTSAATQRMRGLEIVVERRLSVAPNASTAQWYLWADPAAVATLVWGHLEGEGDGPTLTQQDEFDVDGVTYKARLFFGAGFEDFRGIARNAGA